MALHSPMKPCIKRLFSPASVKISFCSSSFATSARTVISSICCRTSLSFVNRASSAISPSVVSPARKREPRKIRDQRHLHKTTSPRTCHLVLLASHAAVVLAFRIKLANNITTTTKTKHDYLRALSCSCSCNSFPLLRLVSEQQHDPIKFQWPV